MISARNWLLFFLVIKFLIFLDSHYIVGKNAFIVVAIIPTVVFVSICLFFLTPLITPPLLGPQPGPGGVLVAITLRVDFFHLLILGEAVKSAPIVLEGQDVGAPLLPLIQYTCMIAGGVAYVVVPVIGRLFSVAYNRAHVLELFFYPEEELPARSFQSSVQVEGPDLSKLHRRVTHEALLKIVADIALLSDLLGPVTNCEGEDASFRPGFKYHQYRIPAVGHFSTHVGNKISPLLGLLKLVAQTLDEEHLVLSDDLAKYQSVGSLPYTCCETDEVCALVGDDAVYIFFWLQVNLEAHAVPLLLEGRFVGDSNPSISRDRHAFVRPQNCVILDHEVEGELHILEKGIVERVSGQMDRAEISQVCDAAHRTEDPRLLLLGVDAEIGVESDAERFADRRDLKELVRISICEVGALPNCPSIGYFY